MAKTISSLKTKEQTHIKIFNFYIRKKTLVIVGIVLLVLFVIIKYNQAQKQKELEARILAQQYNGQVDTTNYNTEIISLEEQIQRSLRETYGIPPEGFKWDYQGNLVALADIEDMTAEDVVYTYLQSVHMLDFATAQRVAYKSSIIDKFDEYYSEINSMLGNNAVDYERNILKLCLETMQIEGISNTVVQADGTYVFTVDLTCLDLTNKEFWREDESTLFQTMYAYASTEEDSDKKNSYIYSYIYDAYKNNLCGYRTINVDIVVGKANSGGWLVTDDYALTRLLLNSDGLSVPAYIQQQYNEWVLELQGNSTSSTYDADIGFGRNDEVDETVDAATDVSEKQSTTNQKLQEDLEYYKQHGTLDRTAESITTESSEDKENNTSSSESSTTEEVVNQAGGATETEQNTTAEQQTAQQEKMQNQEDPDDIGYGRGE